MYFFGKQRDAAANSRILSLAFLLSLVLFAVVVHFAVNAFSMILGDTQSLFESTLQAKVMVGIIWLAVLLGCIFRYMDVRAGGPALAQKFGATAASDTRRFSNEKVLMNVVNEMAIAASCPVPETFVLRSQYSINAFVVGSLSDEKPKALVVTQGAIDQLDREELQAVIGHEMGHIAHGDIPVNMKMLILLGGLLAIDEVGEKLMPKGILHIGFIVGFALKMLGFIGVMVASLLRAAFSRQREFHADASAVQYSRNPLAMASALSKVRDSIDSELHSHYAGELAHLCFHSCNISVLDRFMSSHPPLQSRIDEIDPYFSTKKRAQARLEEQRPDTGVSLAWQTPVLKEGLLDPQTLPDRVSLMLYDTPSCLAALFAVFASNMPTKRAEYLDAVAFTYNPLFAEQVAHLLQEIPYELQEHKSAIVSFATERLRDKVQLENRQRLMLNLERLLMVEGEYNILNYASAQLVRKQLDVEFPLVDKLAGDEGGVASQSNVKTFDEMGSEFALLLSLMVESSGASEEILDKEFSKVLKFYTESEHTRRSMNDPGIHNELEQAFQTLYVQPKSVRQAFVQHCVEIMHHDGHVARAEQALIGLFAASLDCDLVAA